jgi:hypothetical protein
MFEQLTDGVQAILTSIFSVATSLAVVYGVAKLGTENFFAKRLETFRAQLNSEAEAQRYLFQRDLSNYALFAPAKHEAYRKIFRGYLVAEGAFAALSGSSNEPEWQQMTTEEIRAALLGHEVSPSSIERILANWNSDRKLTIDEISKAVFYAKVAKAQKAYVEFNNTRLEWRLYCSENAYAVIKEASDALAELAEHYREEPSSSKGVAGMKEVVNAQARLLLAALRSELSIGA